jgi:hydroxymethylbilane synthase
MRGNVETRLRKLTEQSIDALVLAQAGLERLGLRDSITEILDPSWMLPAVGQGALALECRVEDQVVCELLGKLNDPPTAFAVRAERAMLRALGGGCRVPIGAASNVDGDSLRLRGGVLSPNGTSRIEAQIVGQAAQCESLGRQLADELLAGGAAALLASTSP